MKKTSKKRIIRGSVIGVFCAVVLVVAAALVLLPGEEKVAKNGDVVSIYFEGFLNGERFAGGTGDFDLELGSGQFVPGFEDQLIGAKKGEIREVRLRFPDQYVPGLAGREVMFKVTIKEIR